MKKFAMILSFMIVLSALYVTYAHGVFTKKAAVMAPLLIQTRTKDSDRKFGQLAQTVFHGANKQSAYFSPYFSIISEQPPGSVVSEYYTISIKKASIYEEPDGKVTKDTTIAGMIYEKDVSKAQDDWAFIRGTMQLAEDPKQVAGWVRTDALCDLKTVYSDSGILYRTAYIMNNLKFTKLPGKTKKGADYLQRNHASAMGYLS